MVGKQQAYQDYKDSNVGWMGAVPSHWEILPCRSVVKNLVDKNEGAKDQNYLSLMANVGVILYDNKGDVGNKKPDDLSKCKIVKKGNLVINSMNYAIGSYGMSAYDGVCSPVYIVLDTNSELVEQRFALRLFENSTFQKYLATFGNGILEHRAAIGWDDIKGAYIPLPTKLEQKAILSFLDYETAKIDTLIAKQQQLIALLKEKRQAVISHVVTKGLNPNVPMRDSGVEWLGEVPAHWRVSKFNYEIDFLEGPGILAYDFFEEGVPLLRIQDVKEQFVTDDYKTFLSPSKVKDKWDHFRVKLGDLIISCSASTGLVSEVDLRSVGAVPYTGLIRLRPLTNRITKDYIFFIVQSNMFFEQINNLQTGSTMQHFGPYHLQQMYITLPSLDEQKNLVRHVKRVIADIDRLIEKAQQAVELMQERRTALISAAVTGKIDVRCWQAPEPSKNINNNN